MAITSSINLDKVSGGIKSLNTGIGQLKKSADNVKIVTLNRTRIKRESITRNRMLGNMREEAVKRKEQESIIEASGISGAFKRTGSVITDSTKGFLGRLLDFASSLLLGWLLYNLPTIMTGIENLIIRIKSLYSILTDFMSNLKNTFQNFGNLLSAVYLDITQFDFTDQSKKVQTAMDDLNVNLDLMHNEFMKGFQLLTTPLGQGPGEKEVPPLNTDYTQPGPTTGGGEGGGIERISKTIAKAETGGRYTAYAGDDGKGNREITKMTLTQLRQKYGDYNTAVGAYQFMPGTAIGLAKQLKLDPNKTVFTPEVQDRLNQYHLKTMGYEQFKSGKLSQAEFGTRIAQQYRALPDPRTGRTYADQYAKDNAAQVPLSEFNTALKESKEQKSTQLSANFASVSGTSGYSMKNKPLNVPYSPFKPGSGAQITSGMGYRWGKQHKGYDLAAPSGTPLYAYFPGKVTHIGIDGTSSSAGYGNWVVWKDDIYGAYHFFGHMRDRPSVKVGQVINQGTLMGYVGSTGISTGPHLHWEISSNAPTSNGQFSSLEDPGAWLRRHPLKATTLSQTNTNNSPNPSLGSILPAQVSSTTAPGQNFPAITQNKKGQQVVVVDDRQPPAPQQVISRGGGSQSVPFEDSLNSLIKNQILLELAYT